jgi:ribose transport system permease protein
MTTKVKSIDEAAQPPGSWSERTHRYHPIAGWKSAALKWRGIPATSLALLALVLSVIIQPGFLTPVQLTPFLATYGPVAILAIGVAFTLLVGGIDLSVGPVMGVCAILTVLLSSVGLHLFKAGPSGAAAICANPRLCQQGLPFPVVVVVVIAVGALFGLVNGLVITVGRLQPLVATLAMGFVAAGFALFMMPQPGGSTPIDLLAWYGAPAMISVPLQLLVGCAVAAAILMRTPLGVHMRAVGSDRWKAFASGVKVLPTTLSAYVVSGMCAGIAGVLFTLNSGSADPNVGITYTLTAVAGAVLGGTALRGGWADPFGPVVGVLALGLLAQLVAVANVPTYYAQLATGVIILAGLSITELFLRRANRSGA